MRLLSVLVWGTALGLGLGPGVSRLGAASTQEIARAKKSAEDGEAAAQVAWGIMHENGDGVPQNATEASKWYRLAAEQNDAEGAFRLGFLYARGEGLPHNNGQAAQWYEVAAKQNHALAQLSLGWLCFHGDGLPRDVNQAIKWFTRAADAGDASAQYTLGVVLSGTYSEVPVDLPAAARWFERAAKQGMATAQFRFGSMLAYGDGVTANNEEACFWLTVAVAQLPAGSFRDEADGVRTVVVGRLGDTARADIEKRAASWKP